MLASDPVSASWSVAMAFRITATREAEAQLAALSVRDRRIVDAAILSRLADRPTTLTRAIKRLRPKSRGGVRAACG